MEVTSATGHARRFSAERDAKGFLNSGLRRYFFCHPLKLRTSRQRDALCFPLADEWRSTDVAGKFTLGASKIKGRLRINFAFQLFSCPGVTMRLSFRGSLLPLPNLHR